ncbi:MATE family efflux transporter, partial [Ruminococcus champanellensis]
MNKDLTTGSANRALILFTLPMFISVIFQQLYNMADSVIAGRYAGEDALAAVGASYPITMIFMAVAVGSQVGCSVVIS